MSKSAVLIITHFLGPQVVGMFRRMRAETHSDIDIFIALNLDDKPLKMPAVDADIEKALFLCNTAKLLELAYPEKCRPQGWSGDGWKAIDNIDTITLSFFRDHPDYAYYWGIEYDVYYQGRWGFLFERFETSDADLLGTMLEGALKVSYKTLMPPFKYPDGTAPDYKNSVTGFFPIHRLSQRMAQTIDACYTQGWNGHYEFTWATMAKHHELKIEDIGGAGPYVKLHNKNVFYFNTVTRWDMSPGTFVFRPVFTKTLKRENTLWHPVKPKDVFNHCPALPEDNFVGAFKKISKDFLYGAAIRLWFLFVWRPATRQKTIPRPLRSALRQGPLAGSVLRE